MVYVLTQRERKSSISLLLDFLWYVSNNGEHYLIILKIKIKKFQRDWTLHPQILFTIQDGDSQHDWNNLYDNSVRKRIFTLTMNKTFI